LGTAGPLLDDDLFDVFAEQRPGAKVVFISDSCHSGSVARFAPPLGGAVGGAAGGRPVAAARRARFLPPATFLGSADTRRALAVANAPVKGVSRRTALLLAGCKDTEYSYDASFGDRPNGAFTYVALQALQALPEKASYRQWMAEVHRLLPSQDYPQTPQLTGSASQKKWPVLQ
nr:caspase family protein [Micromonospora sp. DSM 115978]